VADAVAGDGKTTKRTWSINNESSVSAPAKETQKNEKMPFGGRQTRQQPINDKTTRAITISADDARQV
jgi:hypothetical protein